ncbi:MAG TPA: hypothetical protein VHG08_26335 [Longimicrobium sp.]|nr:hypothetical protein [Longimicrobium sp.]
MNKLRMALEDLVVESFATAGGPRAERGTVRGMEPVGESEEGHSWCCYTVYVDQSCPDTCDDTVCNCSGQRSCDYTCVACPTHAGTCPGQSICIDTCWC